MEYKTLEGLLSQSKVVVNKALKSKFESGEDFNVFSILGMETNETQTHSAMLVALLDPKGKHYYKDAFLKLFLDEIQYVDYKDENLSLTHIKAEHYLGEISNDYTSGGFIDILITFPSGKAIAIENKINAGDQPKQMYRYSLYKGGQCDLFYLNKTGNPPSEKSLHTLTDRDYKIISYRTHILNWLEQCLLIVKSGTIIENVIKQYQILIKHLTNSMDKNLEKELHKLIINNLEEAKYIHSHYQKAVDGVKENFRNAVFKKLQIKLPNANVSLGSSITSVYSQIWLKSKNSSVGNALFGIESFSGKGDNNGLLFVGLFHKGVNYEVLRDGDYRRSNYWPVISDIKSTNKTTLDLSNIETLEQLISSKEYFNDLVDTIVEQTSAFFTAYHNHYFEDKSLAKLQKS
jgi:hypothetical protein